MKIRLRHVYACLLPISFIAILSACGSGISNSSYDPANGTIKLELPNTLNQHLRDDLQISTRLSVNDDTEYQLDFDTSFDKLTGQISRLEQGKHKLTLRYLLVRDQEETEIAYAIFTLTVGKDSPAFILLEEFGYTDSDLDGISNIAEINFGTNIFDPVDVPNTYGTRHSSHYIVQEDASHALTIGTSKATTYELK